MKIPETLGWRNTPVRHIDGRTGTITRESIGLGFVDLKITVADGTTTEAVLSSRVGGDRGHTGWSWLCENFSGGPAWLALGEQPDVKPVYVEAEKAVESVKASGRKAKP